MAKKTLHLNSLYSTAIHTPKTKSGYTLYTKVKNFTGTPEGGEMETKAEQDPAYINVKDRVYNSPTNIKRLFLTVKRARVHYFTGYVKDNTTSALEISHEIKDESTSKNIWDAAKDIVEYEQNMSRYYMQKAIDKNAEQPDEYSVDGKFNFCTYPYVMSNIEEIYFDWGVLMSSEIAPYFQKLLPGINPAKVATTFAAFNDNVIHENDEYSSMILNMFSSQSAGGSKDLRKKFPRLKEITFISNLDILLDESLNALSNDKLVVEQDGNPYDTWFNKHKSEILSLGSTFIIRFSMQIKNPNTDFIVKTNQYKFDSEKLSNYVESYKDKVRKLSLEAKYGKSEDIPDVEESDINDIERRLREIEEKYGESAMINVWSIGCAGSGLGKEDIKSILSNISKNYRSKLGKQVGIDIQ